jgi:hypothetical protein
MRNWGLIAAQNTRSGGEQHRPPENEAAVERKETHRFYWILMCTVFAAVLIAAWPILRG